MLGGAGPSMALKEGFRVLVQGAWLAPSPQPRFHPACSSPALPIPDSTLSRWPDRLSRHLPRAAGPRELCRLPRLRCSAGSRLARSVGNASPRLPPCCCAQWRPCCRAPCAGRWVAAPCALCCAHTLRQPPCLWTAVPAPPPPWWHSAPAETFVPTSQQGAGMCHARHLSCHTLPGLAWPLPQPLCQPGATGTQSGCC